jgi:hypothetical protein
MNAAADALLTVNLTCSAVPWFTVAPGFYLLFMVAKTLSYR